MNLLACQAQGQIPRSCTQALPSAILYIKRAILKKKYDSRERNFDLHFVNGTYLWRCAWHINIECLWK